LSPPGTGKKPVDQETVDGLLPLVKGLVRRLGPPPEGASPDDVWQQAWAEVLKALGRYRPVDAVDRNAYLWKAALFGLRRWRRKTVGLQGRNSSHKIVFSRPHDELARQAELRADREELDPVYWLTLRRVADWELVWAVAVEGYSFSEVAKRLGCPRSSIFDRYKRAVRLLRAEW